MEIAEVGTFTIVQNGSFVCRLMFDPYIAPDGKVGQSNQTDNMLVGQTYTGIDPGKLLVPDGSIIVPYLWVMASAYDYKYPQSYRYNSKSSNSIVFVATGETGGGSAGYPLLTKK